VYELFNLGKISVGPRVRRDVPGADDSADGVSCHRHAFGLAPRQLTASRDALVAARRGRAGVRAGEGWDSARSTGSADRSVVRFWIIFSALIEPVQRLRRGQKLTPGLLGMVVAHIGVGVFAIGASGVESYRSKRMWP